MAVSSGAAVGVAPCVIRTLYGPTPHGESLCVRELIVNVVAPFSSVWSPGTPYTLNGSTTYRYVFPVVPHACPDTSCQNSSAAFPLAQSLSVIE
jgi:hypothetical protein